MDTTTKRRGEGGGGKHVLPRDDSIPYSPPYRPLGHFLALDAPQEGEKVPVRDVGRVRRVSRPFPAFLLQPAHHLSFRKTYEQQEQPTDGRTTCVCCDAILLSLLVVHVMFFQMVNFLSTTRIP